MSAHPILTALVAAYLLGSIPFGYVLVRVFRGTDVRGTGSGNIGATNVARTSPLLGLLTLLLDAGKGITAVALALEVFPGARPFAYAAAFAAICGHVFPVWLGFRGGKGVATGLGAFLLLSPKAILVTVGVFLVIAAAIRWIALASIVAAAALPIAAALIGRAASAEFSAPLAWVTAGAALIIVKHHSNIRRMLAGTEPKFQLKHE